MNGHAAVVMTSGDGGILLVLDVIATIADGFDWPQYLEERAAITPNQATLRSMSGTYQFEPGSALVIRGDGARLWSSGTGLPEGELFATGPTEFLRLDLDATTISWADTAVGPTQQLGRHSSWADTAVGPTQQSPSTSRYPRRRAPHARRCGRLSRRRAPRSEQLGDERGGSGGTVGR